MRTALGDVLRLQKPRHRRRFAGVVVVSLLVGLCEVVGVASVAPFVALAADPSLLERNAALAAVHGALGTGVDGTVAVLGACAFALLAATVVARNWGYHVLMGFVQRQAADLSVELFDRYLAEPYDRFLGRRPSDMAAALASEVEEVASGAILGAMRIVAYGLIALAIGAVLVALEPVGALAIGTGLALAYGGLYAACRGPLFRLGRRRVDETRRAHRALVAAMASVREAKLSGTEARLVAGFAAPAGALARIRTRMSLLELAPRGGLEILTFGGMILFALWTLAARGGDLAAALPLLGIYAVAAMRLFPVLQRLFSAAAGFRAAAPALADLAAEIAAHRARPSPAAAALPCLRREIRIERGRFAFPGAARSVIEGVDLAIPAGGRVGLVGPTGAGKSTVAEVVAGLLPLTDGRLVLDGRPLDDAARRAWGRSIGYAPQRIELLPATIAANIAFDGEAPDPARLERAARLAQVDAFVRELPGGFDAVVGAGGLRLSGGQAQRIGLARALYRDPPVLILDEATSALDAQTEQRVLHAVFGLGGKTILMIAHRLSSVRRCGLIYHLDGGRVVGHGSFDALRTRSPRFRALCELAA